MKTTIINIAKAAKHAASILATTSNANKNQALQAMATALRQQTAEILIANHLDFSAAQTARKSPAFLDRLVLDDKRIAAMAQGLEAIMALDDPVGKILHHITRPNGLDIARISVPLGVIGIIYESRPNVTADAAGLALKAGNATILRCGSESFHSATAILKALHLGLAQANLPKESIQLIPTIDRAAVEVLLTLDEYIDVLIPRGGPALIQYIVANSRIPLFKHLAGLCHTYIHKAADLSMARKVLLNAKMRRTGICGATEVLLIDREIVATHLPALIADLKTAHCEIRGEPDVAALDPDIRLANADDYDTEYLDAIISVKIVDNLSAALAHIAQHSTKHTDAIITNDKNAADIFLQNVDSAIVMHNTSTQFADGGEFGMGAEIGISTGKLHARGPVGVAQLTIFKYIVRGNGQIRQ